MGLHQRLAPRFNVTQRKLGSQAGQEIPAFAGMTELRVPPARHPADLSALDPLRTLADGIALKLSCRAIEESQRKGRRSDPSWLCE